MTTQDARRLSPDALFDLRTRLVAAVRGRMSQPESLNNSVKGTVPRVKRARTRDELADQVRDDLRVVQQRPGLARGGASVWEGEAPAEPLRPRLGRSLALPKKVEPTHYLARRFFGAEPVSYAASLDVAPLSPGVINRPAGRW